MSSEGSGSKRLLPWLLAAVVVLGAALYLAAGRGGASAPVAPSDPSAPPAPRAPRGPRQQAGAAAPAHKLSVGVLPNGESDLVYVAAALGYFEAEGLDVELARMPRGRRALGALVRGGVDVAIAGDISLATEDFDRTANVVIATVGHADEHLLVLGRKDRGVAAVSDLKGKRVGIEARMNPRYLTHRLLAAHGLGEADVTLVELKLKQLPGALLRGDLDAIVDPRSDFHRAVRETAEAPGVDLVTIAEPGSYRVSFNAVAERALVEREPAVLRAFLRALLHALDHAAAHKEEAARAVAGALAVEGRKVDDEWEHVVFEVSLDRSLASTLDTIAAWDRAAGHDRTTSATPFAAMIYPDLLRAERPASVTLAPAAAP